MSQEKRLKISFLLPNSGVGGGVRAIMRFGNVLLERGHAVRIFYRNSELLKSKLRNIYWNYRGWNHDWLDDFKGPVIEFSRLENDQFEEDEFVIAMCARTTLDAWSLSKGFKLLHSHGAEIENWQQMLETWQLPMPKIAVSWSLGRLIKREVNYNVLGVVTDGVDQTEYYPAVPEDARIGIGTSFRWRESKDPEGTINVLNRLRNRLPDVPLFVYGSGRKPSALKGVKYYRQPSVAQAREIYSKCKVWFLNSKDEGFGMPVLEAMACGCAVVSTDCGGPGDIIQSGTNGILTDVGNSGAMVYNISKLYQNDDLRKFIVKNSMLTTKSYSWSRSAIELEKILYQLKENTLIESGV